MQTKLDVLARMAAVHHRSLREESIDDVGVASARLSYSDEKLEIRPALLSCH